MRFLEAFAALVLAMGVVPIAANARPIINMLPEVYGDYGERQATSVADDPTAKLVTAGPVAFQFDSRIPSGESEGFEAEAGGAAAFAGNAAILSGIVTAAVTNVAPNAIPEPAGFAMLGLGLVGVAAARRRKGASRR